MRHSLLAAAAFAAVAAAPATSAELPRKAFLGVQLQPAPEGGGVMVGAVIPGGTGEAMGIRAGDIVTAVNGAPTATPGDVVTLAKALTSGQRVSVNARRGEQTLVLEATAKPKPVESYAGATVDYGAVSLGDDRLRDILVMPAAKPDAPVVFYIQGYTCGSIEAGQGEDLYRRLGEELVRRGIGYYRVEKIGLGDSSGPRKCQDVGFADEVAGFRAAYRHLVAARKVAPERIFILGHSMGGIQAPFLAAETAPRGVAIYGIGLKNWADYYQDVASTQSFLIGGQDPVEAHKVGEQARDVIRDFYINGKAPKDIAATAKGGEQFVREILSWDGGQYVFGRSFRFAQDLPRIELIDAWKKSRTNVLSMYGESDMVALTDVDHKYLVEIVNHWRPGTATYKMIAKTDHPMNLVGTREEVRRLNRTGAPPPKPTFSTAVVDTLAAWIDQSMARPPIAVAG